MAQIFKVNRTFTKYLKKYVASKYFKIRYLWINMQRFANLFKVVYYNFHNTLGNLIMRRQYQFLANTPIFKEG